MPLRSDESVRSQDTTSRRRLCVVTTHPIQYIVPWFRELADRSELELHVIFFRQLDDVAQGTGFGRAFAWDIPMLAGYDSETLNFRAGCRPGSSTVRQLWRAMSSCTPDVVLVTGWNEPMLVVAQVVARLQRVPLLVRGESNALRRRSRWVHFAHRLLMRLPNAFLSIGRSNSAFYANAGVEPGRLFQGAYFVENERLRAQAKERTAERATLRRAVEASDDDFVVLFCGKHVAFKRPMLLLEAAAALRQRGIAAKVVYAGSGELSDELRKHAANLEVPTHFTGFLNQSELWRAYLLADAFVLPSDTGETWGLVTNEAMLFGLPVVVSTEVGCAEDLVVPGQTGYTFSGGAQELANELEKLAVNRTEARRMGEIGRAHVQQNYSMEVATEGLMTAIRAIAR